MPLRIWHAKAEPTNARLGMQSKTLMRTETELPFEESQETTLPAALLLTWALHLLISDSRSLMKQGQCWASHDKCPCGHNVGYGGLQPDCKLHTLAACPSGKGRYTQGAYCNFAYMYCIIAGSHVMPLVAAEADMDRLAAAAKLKITSVHAPKLQACCLL